MRKQSLNASTETELDSYMGGQMRKPESLGQALTWGIGVMSKGEEREGVTRMQYQIFVNNKLSFPSPHLTIINDELAVTRDTCAVRPVVTGLTPH